MAAATDLVFSRAASVEADGSTDVPAVDGIDLETHMMIEFAKAYVPIALQAGNDAAWVATQAAALTTATLANINA